MIIRQLQESDYQDFLELIDTFRETQFSKSQYLNLLHKIQNHSEIWICEIGGKIGGSATLVIEHKFIFNISKVGHIEDVITHPEYRKQGIGRAIMQKLRERAKEHGCYKITLACSEEVKPFYEKCDMEQRGIQMSSLL